MGELRRLDHDALTSYEAGNANLRVPDEAVLAFARRSGRIVVTGNRKHFIRLHRQGEVHDGIVVFTERYDPIPTARRIDAALGDARARGRFLVRIDGVSHTFDP